MVVHLELGGVIAPNPGFVGGVAVKTGMAVAGLSGMGDGTGGAKSPGDATGWMFVGVPVVMETSAGRATSPSRGAIPKVSTSFES